ncbi:hypothetical protein MCUN1_003625 [Malassezia cuniculi]|uniref:Uncharacterized protein n=1 Tax=Malassezia cuniculi TaxID=948313 RepID=A0AAF0ETG7_9BASI|nr:hypothetical protein MCUN1_003625 [Malassezia cuniculi]
MSTKKAPSRVASSGHLRSTHTRNDSGGSFEAFYAATFKTESRSLSRKLSTLVLRHNKHEQEVPQQTNTEQEAVYGYMPAIILGPNGAFQGIVYVPRSQGPGSRIVRHCGDMPPPQVPYSLLTEPLPPVPTRRADLRPPNRPPIRRQKSFTPDVKAKTASTPQLAKQQETDEEFQGILRDWQNAFGTFVSNEPMPAPRPATAPNCSMSIRPAGTQTKAQMASPTDYYTPCTTAPLAPNPSVPPTPNNPVFVQDKPRTPVQPPVTSARGLGRNSEESSKSTRNLASAIRMFLPDKNRHNASEERPGSRDTAQTTSEDTSVHLQMPSPAMLSPDPSLGDIQAQGHQAQGGKRTAKQSIRNLGRRLASTWGAHEKHEI